LTLARVVPITRNYSGENITSIGRFASLIAATGIAGVASSANTANVVTLNIGADAATTGISLASGPASFQYGGLVNPFKTVGTFQTLGSGQFGSFAATSALAPGDSYQSGAISVADCNSSCILNNSANPFLHLKFQSGAQNYFGVAAFNSAGTLSSISYAAAVPEPAAWALLVSGFGLAGVAMRRRRREASLAVAA
jgi:hypothetical protein